MKYFICLVLVSVMLLVGGCNVQDSGMTACEASIPTYTDFVHDAVFSSLSYHKREEYSLDLRKGYDLWTDSNFEFHSGLQFSFVPKNTDTANKYCVNAVLLRLALPLNAQQKAMLAVFSDKIATDAGVERIVMHKLVERLMANGSKFNQVFKNNRVLINAGIVHHPNRGDFFAIAVETLSNEAH